MGDAEISAAGTFQLGKADNRFLVPDTLAIPRLIVRATSVTQVLSSDFHYPDIRLKDREAHYEWSLLDTHDSITDFYKHMRTPRQIEQLLGALGARDIVVRIGGNGVEAFCRKPW